MVRDMNTAEILRAAAASVRQGWCQRNYYHRGSVCAIGAICLAKGMALSALTYSSEICAIETGPEVMAATLALNVSRLTDWNDHEDQTQANVAAGLEYAALVYEQEHLQSSEAVGVRVVEG